MNMNISDYYYADLPADYHIVQRHHYYDLLSDPFGRSDGGGADAPPYPPAPPPYPGARPAAPPPYPGARPAAPAPGPTAAEPASSGPPGSNTGGGDETSYGFARLVFVLVARIGFIMIQIGSIPVENVYRIILYNVLEIAAAVASYSMVGVIFSVGPKSAAGVIGYTLSSNTGEDIDLAILGLAACLLATAQMSTFLIGRIHAGGALLLTSLYCGLFQPIIAHWIWNKIGWMSKSNFLGKRVSVKDHAGGIVVHLTSSITGAIGALFLGRRLVKLKDVDPFTFGTGNVASTTIGYILIIIGCISMGFPTVQYLNVHTQDYIGQAMLNSLVGIAAGIIIVAFMHYLVYGKLLDYWTIQRCIQGGLAGIVALSSGVDAYSPVVAYILATIAALFFFFFAVIIHNTALEDCCNMTSAYLVCSFLGSFLCPLVAQRDNLGTAVSGSTRGIHFLWQFICLVVVIIFTVVFAVCVFGIMEGCNILRNKYEIANHKRGLALQFGLTKRGYLERLFVVNVQTDHLVPGYRRKYADVPAKDAPKSPTRITFSDEVKTIADKGRQFNQDLETKRKKDIKTVNYFSAKTTWPAAGSGDYCGEFSDATLSRDYEKPTEIFSLYRSSVLNKYENELGGKKSPEGFHL